VGCARGGGLNGLGESEVEHLDYALGRDFDIRGLQVTVDDALLVGRGKGVGDLPRDGQCLVLRQRAADVGALHEFHDDGVLFQSVNLRDVGMIERRQGLRLVLETRQVAGVGGERLGQNLERHFAVQLGVARAVHLSHSSRAERGDDLVGADSGSRWQRHGSWASIHRAAWGDV